MWKAYTQCMWRLLFTIGGVVWIAFGGWGLVTLQTQGLAEEQLIVFISLYAALCVLPGCLLIAVGRSLGRLRENPVQKSYQPIALLSKEKKDLGQKTTAPQSPQALDVPLVSVTEHPSVWQGELGHRLRVGIASIGVLILLGGAWVLFSRNQPYERLAMESTVRNSTASEALMSGGGEIADFGSVSRHILAQPDWTISQMITAAYGSFNILALDLVKRFNPHIPDLDHITEGEKVWLPPIKKETLIRKQSDSSFHLVIGAFRNLADAHQLAQEVRAQGYVASVTTYQVTADLAVSRVEIGELADLDAVDRAWTLANVQFVPGST